MPPMPPPIAGAPFPFSRRRIVVRIGPLAVAHVREQLAELASALGQARHLE